MNEEAYVKFYDDDKTVYTVVAKVDETLDNNKLRYHLKTSSPEIDFKVSRVELYLFDRMVYFFNLQEPKTVHANSGPMNFSYTRRQNAASFILDN